MLQAGSKGCKIHFSSEITRVLEHPKAYFISSSNILCTGIWEEGDLEQFGSASPRDLSYIVLREPVKLI